MKKTFNQLQFFLLAFGGWFIALMILRFSFSKGVFELSWNQHHHPSLDFFFSYFTWVGSGWFYGFVVLVLFFFGRKKFLAALTAALLCLIISAVLKNIFFTGEQRPLTFFGDTTLVYIPDGVPRLTYGSFPSGHTLSAFSMFTLAAYFVQRPLFQILFFLAAALAGISRIYLMAHFIEDVIIGSLLGLCISVISYNVFEIIYPTGSLTENKILFGGKKS